MARKKRKKRKRPGAPGPAAASQPAGKPPWHPLHLMVLCALPWSAIGGMIIPAVVGGMLLFLPVALVASSVLAAINWRRLGEPRAARQAWGILAIGLALPLVPVLFYGLPHPNLPEWARLMTTIHNLNFFVNMLAPFVHLHLQRGAYDEYEAKGGPHSSVIPLWFVNMPLGFLGILLWLVFILGRPG